MSAKSALCLFFPSALPILDRLGPGVSDADRNNVNLTAIRERLSVQAVRWAPKGLCSAAVGWGARKRLPRPLRAPTYRTFSRVVGAALEEAELPLAEYPSLSHFFARRLRTGSRTLAARDARTIVSPCDGAVAARGRVHRDHMIQAKGMGYTLSSLLVDRDRARQLAEGWYMTIYLSPRDYHRVHAPMDARLIGYDYVPGSYFPVNPLFSRSVEALMARNERVVFHLETPAGAASLVMVAALGVSNIEVAHDGTETRYLRRTKNHQQVRFKRPIELARGDEIGTFNLGSTTIMVFQERTADLDAISVGQTLRFGQAIGQLLDPATKTVSPWSS